MSSGAWGREVGPCRYPSPTSRPGDHVPGPPRARTDRGHRREQGGKQEFYVEARLGQLGLARLRSERHPRPRRRHPRRLPHGPHPHRDAADHHSRRAAGQQDQRRTGSLRPRQREGGDLRLPRLRQDHGDGPNTQYRIVGFINLTFLDYDKDGNITVQYVSYSPVGDINPVCGIGSPTCATFNNWGISSASSVRSRSSSQCRASTARPSGSTSAAVSRPRS